MPDDIPRSASGKTPDQRDSSVPPGWWRDLGRTDLPTGGGETLFHDVGTPDDRSVAIEVVPDEHDGRMGAVSKAVAGMAIALVAIALIVSGDRTAQIAGVAIVVVELFVAIGARPVARRFHRR